MEELRKRAAELLESGTVRLVIGYEQGSGDKVRPVIATRAEDVARLVFDSRCVYNLAVYLTKKEILKKGKPAIVAPVPVLRSIIQLASENQLTDESAVVLGITAESKLIEFAGLKEIEDYLAAYKMESVARDQEIMANLNKMSSGERWAFWMKTLEPCFKCYACRAACPLCYCTQCTVDNNRPQWVPVASHPLGNLEWHIMRAMHMAGRCTGCGACFNACPVGIPLHLLTKKISQEMNAGFGESGPSLSRTNQMATFTPDDKENFIN